MKGKTFARLVCVLLCLALLGTLAGTGRAGGANLLERPANGCVLDVAGVLSRDTVDHMLARNRTLTDASGAAIAVVTVDFLNGKTCQDYAATLFEQWGVGDKEAQNGLLLLLAVGEKDYWAVVGSGIDSALTADALEKYLTEYLEYDFAHGDYDAGVRKVFDAFYQWFDVYYGITAQSDPAADDPAQAQTGPSFRLSGGGVRTVLVVVVVLGVVAFLALVIGRRARRGRGGNRRSGGYSGGGRRSRRSSPHPRGNNVLFGGSSGSRRRR